MSNVTPSVKTSEERQRHPTPSDSLTVAEIAADLHVSEGTVRVWCNTGDLANYRLPGKKNQPIIRVRREDLDRFLADHQRSNSY